tara:strand:+ start:1892 stop:2182 length:291 start_codon:yes stop_codon:yes gene_type:complete
MLHFLRRRAARRAHFDLNRCQRCTPRSVFNRSFCSDPQLGKLCRASLRLRFELVSQISMLRVKRSAQLGALRRDHGFVTLELRRQCNFKPRGCCFI